MDDPSQNNGFGIYIHWPFCESKCPYCDFNSHVSQNIDQRRWAKAFVSELVRYHRETSDRVVNSIFFGGGTPSLMSPELVETILMCISENWKLAKNVEITLEANPSSVEAQKFRDFYGCGINRVSLGIQALNDHDLNQLGRLHTAQEGLQAIEIAQNTFSRVSFDLIYARQAQSMQEWHAELETALAMGTDHLSLYQLTVEDGTAFGKRHLAGKLPGLPSDDLAADMFALTQQLCTDAGVPAYEVSNHARPGAESRHNLIYWNCGDYLGIGPGAHGRLTFDHQRFATDTRLAPLDWLQDSESGSGEAGRETLGQRDQTVEYLMMGLRLADGIDVSRVEVAGIPLLNGRNINELSDLGYIKTSNSRLAVTSQGRIVLNAVIRQLLSDV